MGILWHIVFLDFMELRIFCTFNISEKEDCLALSVRIWKNSVVPGPTAAGLVGARGRLAEVAWLNSSGWERKGRN